ncbi:P-loop containing nucleoside triphosphate hydrolase protein [Gloeopeniophorella convolvens]|nr:P-loop containing nucleoside triphosphate hydrolase protein [Gloeopeniophorella convolvens]
MDPYGQSRYELGIDAKIVVMGNTGVGKTSLLRRYTQGKFGPKNTTSTAGAFFVTKEVSVGGVKVCLQLWDTSGWERFRRMAPMYYRGANAALLLYDITNQASFEGVRGWLEELRKNCAAELIIYIVGAKADLAPRRQVSPDRARTSLHHWFSPPAPISGFAVYGYILPRFTLFAPSHPSPPSAPPDSPSSADALLGSAKSAHAGARVAMPAWGESRVLPGTWPGQNAGGYSVVEDAEADRAGERGWGLAKGIELFEVSAKDDSGACVRSQSP